MSDEKHALIFGASGVSGWGTMIQCLSYSTPTTFTSVTGLTNRALPESALALLPSDPRLSVISGVDLSLASADAVKENLVKTVTEEKLKKVTHVFFYAYIHAPPGGLEGQFAANTKLIDYALIGLRALSPNLKHFILQTGGKTYVGLGPKYAPAQPWNESDAWSPHPEMQKGVFYYGQRDAVQRHAKEAGFTWSEIIPDAILGFTPTANAMNMARPLGIYLGLWRKVYGEGSKVPFPGNEDSWTALNGLSPRDPIARLSIFAALHPEKSHEQAYNIQEDEPTSFSERWGPICAVFGLIGVPPSPLTSDSTTESASMTLIPSTAPPLNPVTGLPPFYAPMLSFARAHSHLLPSWVTDDDLERFDFFDISLLFPFPHSYDNTKRKEQLGWEEKVDAKEGKAVVAALKEAWTAWGMIWFGAV